MKTEINPLKKKYRKGLRKIALVYPNRYVGGISNIGLQYIYYTINNHKDLICERFYYDVHNGIRSVESGNYLKNFDLALFSIQYEADYFKALEILNKSGFKGLTIAGGPCIMENPKPVLKYFDAFFIGECEKHIDEIVRAKTSEDLKGIPGIYTGEETKVKRVYSKLGKHLEQEIIGDGAYGWSFLVEIGRGCIRHCRFCIVRQIYFPPRWRKLKDLPENIPTKKVAIIAPSPSDHPKFKEIVKKYVDRSLQVSPSSLRADTLDEEILELLKDIKTLTIAPEAATLELQESLNKGITSDDVIHTAEIASKYVEKIKLYYMVGLPGESFEDVKAIIDQAIKVKKFVKRVEISVNPLVPKPHTPFQWLPFGGNKNVKEGLKELRKKLRFLAVESSKRGLEADISGVKEFAIQTIISRGDESVSGIFEGVHWRKYLQFLESINVESELPWDFIDHGYKKERLIKEYTETILSNYTTIK